MSAGKVLLLKLLVGLTVLATSFCIALLVIDSSDSERQAERQRSADDVAVAQQRGIVVRGGVRVYSPSAGSAGGVYTAEKAFTGARAPDRFWETDGGFPVDLFVLLPAARAIEQYVLSGGQVSERMPSSWVLEGSRDGIDWFALDRQGPGARWGVDESRTYRVATPRPASLLRFRFAAGFNERILRIYGIELR